MKKKRLLVSIVILFLIVLCTVAFSPLRARAQGATKIYMEPSENIYHVPPTTAGTRFNITFWVQDVSDLVAWQAQMTFNDTVINFTRWFEPTWDSQYVFYGKTTMAAPAELPHPDGGYYLTNYKHSPVEWPDQGVVTVGTFRYPAPLLGQGFTGKGKLAVIECNITIIPAGGVVYSCPLHINHATVYLLNSTNGEIPATKEDGFYSIPEFSAILLLPVFMALTLLAVFSEKKLLGKLKPVRRQ